MAHEKEHQLDYIQFERVSLKLDGLDAVLSHVDMSLPMDQTVILQSSNPSHAMHFLEMIAGRRHPSSGKIHWLHESNAGESEVESSVHELISCFFESQRPSGDFSVEGLLKAYCTSVEMFESAVEQFELHSSLNRKFKDLPFEKQKLLMLILPTFKLSQMLVLEDPSLGLSEKSFLTYLDWIQLWQRHGHFRHVYMTCHHPTALRHVQDATFLFIEDGLVYVEEDAGAKKIALS